MSTSFERVSRFSVGYDTHEVDEFLARARTAYEGRDAGFSGNRSNTGKSTAAVVLCISVALTVVLGAKLFGLY